MNQRRRGVKSNFDLGITTYVWVLSYRSVSQGA
uniref:Uncharacterized protein n=1 Tax=Rhizophora mucronata TaxID=61149 RepID=A0A2P2LHS7_RHIMU